MRLPINRIKSVGKSAVGRGRSLAKGRGKYIAGAVVAGSTINGIRSRGGRAADRPVGRPTGPFMY